MASISKTRGSVLGALALVAVIAITFALVVSDKDEPRPFPANSSQPRPIVPEDAGTGVPNLVAPRNNPKNPDNEPEIAFGRTSFGCPPFDEYANGTDEGRDDHEIEAEARRRYENLTDYLASSPSFDHQLSAAMFKLQLKDPTALDDLLRLRGLLPENPLLYWVLPDACALRPTNEYCQSGQFETDYIESLGSNGEAWAKIAHMRLRSGDENGAIEALHRAASVTVFDDLWGARVRQLFDSLAADSNANVSQRLVEAIGYAAAFGEPYLRIINQCAARGAESPEWDRACMGFARRKAENAKTLMGRALGQGLLRQLHEAAGRNSEWETADRSYREMMDKYLGQLRSGTEELLAHDSTIAIEYLNILADHGEFVASDWLTAEYQRLLRVASYDPCPEARGQM